jgi:hypothetical protein
VRFREEIAGGLADFEHLVAQNHSALDRSFYRRPKYLPDYRQYDGPQENHPDTDNQARNRVDFEEVLQ